MPPSASLRPLPYSITAAGSESVLPARMWPALIRVHCHGSQGATINTIVTLPGGAPWSPLCCMSHAAASTVPRGLGPKYSLLA